MILTCHVRHSSMSINQTNEKIFILCNILSNATIQPHSRNQDCCKQKRTCLIVATVSPISHRPPVHHGTTFIVLIY